MLFGAVAILPPALMLARSLWAEAGGLTWGHYLAVWQDPRQPSLLLRSLCIALGAALASGLLGSIQAFLLVCARLPLKRLWQSLYLLPLCIPPHLHAVAWVYLFGETGTVNRLARAMTGANAPILEIYTASWSGLILAVAYHPLVTLMVCSGLLSMDRRLEEAARQYHAPARVLSRVTLPLLTPHILSGMVFVFIFAFFNYGVPALLRVHTYPVEIFAQFSAFYDEAAAMALSVPLIACSICLLALQRWWMGGRSHVVIDTGGSRPAAAQLRRGKTAVIAFMACFSLLAVGLPLIVLVLETRTLSTFTAIWNSAGREIVSTTMLCLAAASVITLLAFLLANARKPRRGKESIGLELLLHAPLALPATVMGIGLIYTWNRPVTQIVYASVLILLIAYTARFVPFSLLAVSAGMRQVGPELREAAQLCRRSWLKCTLTIEMPLVLPALMAGWAIAFVFCMGELGATLLVIPPGMGTLSLKIYNLMHYGASRMVAGLSLILISINLLAAGGAWLVARRFGWAGRRRALTEKEA